MVDVGVLMASLLEAAWDGARGYIEASGRYIQAKCMSKIMADVT